MVKDTQGYSRSAPINWDELPSENSHLIILIQTVNSYCGGKTTRGDGIRLSSGLAYPEQPMVCFQFVDA